MRTLDLWKTERENSANEKVADLNIQRVLKENCKPVARIWRGKALNPYYHYSFRNVEQMEQCIRREIENRVKNLEEKAQRKITDKEIIKNHKLDIHIGQIWVSHWGYDQTNIDFYEVVDVRGRAVMLQKIGSHSDDAGCYMQYKVKPNRLHKIGEPFKKIVQLQVYEGKVSEYINLASYKGMSKWNGQLCHQTCYA